MTNSAVPLFAGGILLLVFMGLSIAQLAVTNWDCGGPGNQTGKNIAITFVALSSLPVAVFVLGSLGMLCGFCFGKIQFWA